MKGSSEIPLATRHLGAGLAALALVLTAACSGSENADATGGGEAEPATAMITPEDGSDEVKPNLPVKVESEDGTITDVAVQQSGGEAPKDPDDMSGSLNKDENVWVSDWNLYPGSDVEVTATVQNEDGEESEVVSEFSTQPATDGQRLELMSNFPTSDETVGVGMPVIINFDQAVENKKQVENSIEVTSEEGIEGAYNWFGDEMAVFRPKEYWEPNQEITVDIRLAGVEASDGVFGTENSQINFEVGREQISTVDDKEHTMVVERDGEEIKEFPISNGDASKHIYTTTSGTHLTMEKYQHLVMDSSTVGIPVDSPEGYKLDVNYAVRTSGSGEFTHSAPWNGQLGESNESHGCTNMAPKDAKWFYEESLMGDPFIVTGTDRELEVDNGWGFYQRSWEEWLEHSETGKADKTDGNGTVGSAHGEPDE
ncbi:lipoprotein-anchoring transpeptidase ErfK/SrfK [Lipingzhangella halophila]|uniref:Lipoprotein-anchoring transpeptidase ErfK/SrfK n=1 Tax=Lipingzhangella halophila TaxID=1783352 RepID=A0A7W7RFQ3_9ACTN|nr:Ig-like domain-containing protein [Lipingzhangella halophila]MBB4930818.1 lipoprotein-anchoring transpeptidase ErfK/SrfK [Lipingzhangella halophila]